MRVPVSYPVTDWMLDRANLDRGARYELIIRLAGQLDISVATADAIVDAAITNRLYNQWPYASDERHYRQRDEWGYEHDLRNG